MARFPQFLPQEWTKGSCTANFQVGTPAVSREVNEIIEDYFRMLSVDEKPQ